MGNESGKSGGLFQTSQKGGYEQIKDDMSAVCKCSIKTRLIGYVACFIVGMLLSFISTVVFLVKKDYVMFAILYSLGQFLNITGSCFLATPKTQVKDMFKKTRWVLTLLYLGSAIATLVLALVLPQNLKSLVILTLIIQIISYYLYTFSYVPFGRRILKKCCQCILFD